MKKENKIYKNVVNVTNDIIEASSRVDKGEITLEEYFATKDKIMSEYRKYSK